MRISGGKTFRSDDKARSIKKRGARRRLLAALAFFTVSAIVLIILEAIRCRTQFVVTPYTFKTEKVSAPVKLVMVSDLHESRFGSGNSRLIEAVEELEPDVIVCVGDMITHTDTPEQTRIGLDFMQAMPGIAPTYMSLGNHECTYIDKHGAGILDDYRACGVTLLEESYAEVDANGQRIRIGGIYGYCFNYGQKWSAYHSSHKYLFLRDFCDTEEFTLLLCHRPTSYYLKSEAASYEDWDIDLVLSGHTHGGLWRVPGIGGIYLPQQGFFPKLDYGRKNMGNAQMIIGAGLGHEAVLFRLFDPCEIVVITLVPTGAQP